jgi:hypothetical protein
MSRILFEVLLPLLLPTLLFAAWAILTRRRASAGTATWLQSGPWFWLVLAGFALLVAALIYSALSSGGDPTSRIIPPRFEDGRVVPAQIE